MAPLSLLPPFSLFSSFFFFGIGSGFLGLVLNLILGTVFVNLTRCLVWARSVFCLLQIFHLNDFCLVTHVFCLTGCRNKMHGGRLNLFKRADAVNRCSQGKRHAFHVFIVL